ncbi:ceramide kinase isoform X1 [Mauremys reevesii]|uniref:ceramide kinase isoform X1 n=2 Tax=Mauremys reevesii TaxID=260615 RepID=UPI00193F6D03|nr:ceramide kinase isoform X1 [Mauremys reevesii]
MEQPVGGRRPRLVSSLALGQRAWEVTLEWERGLLSWRDPQPARGRGGGNCFVPASEIIAVEETEIDEKQCSSGKWQKMAKPHAFTVYYVKRAQKHRWRCSEVTFWCVDEQLCNQWIQALKDLLELQKSRPKQLLVYINPYGGKRQGKRIYEQKVAPLFSLASISTDVIITEHANHAKDNLFEVNIYKYDGIVCVGGDGMFSEVMHGLIGRIQKDSGIDQNNPKAPLVQCNIRIGIIPAGSTDCICYATVGVTDPVTSALHIIVGDSQPLDVSSIHHNNTFLKYSVSLLGYGFYGDILKDSEKKRWMGTIRYDFSGFKTFLSHHYYEGTVSFLPAKHTLGSPRDKKRCRTGCLICRQSKQQPEEPQKKYGLEHNEDEGGEDWKVIKGKFLAINAVNMSCACPRSPKGLSPAAHLADGSIDLILVRKCSRFNFLRYLVRHTNQDDQFDFTFVEVYRVKKFQFTSKHLEDNDNDVKDVGKKRFGQFCRDHPTCCCNLSNSIWNCDGETLDSSTIEVKVHCQLMKLFARGIEENSNDEAVYNQSTVEQLL